MTTEPVYVFPIFHPREILRGRWQLDPLQPIYMQNGLRTMRDGLKDIEQPPPGVITDPTPDELTAWYNAVMHGVEHCTDFWDDKVTVDIECAGNHLTLVGLMHIGSMKGVVLRFRGVGGEVLRRNLRVKVELLDEVLCSPRIGVVFHNGQTFDIPVLESIGFEVRYYAWDTLIAWWAAWPELPKRLEFVANIFGVPMWKSLSKPEDDADK